jgi:hypothetical protein
VDDVFPYAPKDGERRSIAIGHSQRQRLRYGFGGMRLPTEDSVTTPRLRRTIELDINYVETPDH